MLSQRCTLLPVNSVGLASPSARVLGTIDRRVLRESPKGDSKRRFYTVVNTWWRGTRRRRRRERRRRRRQRALGDATIWGEDFRARRASAH